MAALAGAELYELKKTPWTPLRSRSIRQKCGPRWMCASTIFSPTGGTCALSPGTGTGPGREWPRRRRASGWHARRSDAEICTVSCEKEGSTNRGKIACLLSISVHSAVSPLDASEALSCFARLLFLSIASGECEFLVSPAQEGLGRTARSGSELNVWN